MYKEIERKNILNGLIPAFMFPFKPGVLSYNLIAALIISVLFYVMFPSFELGVAGKKISFNLTHIFILAVMATVMATVMAKNFDIAAQIAKGDDDISPSFKSNNYVSLYIVLKFIAISSIVLCLFFITTLILVLLSIPKTIAMVVLIPLLMAFTLLIPALILTLIRTSSLLQSLNPRRIKATITQHIGIINYIQLAGFLFLMASLEKALSYSLQALAASGFIFIIAYFISQFLILHFVSSYFYLMGFMTQDDTEEDLKPKVVSKRTKKKPTPENTDVSDARQCIANGYPEDAITLLNNAIITNAHSPEDNVAIRQLLIKTYQQTDNKSLANEHTLKLIDYVIKTAPYLKNRVLPNMLALYKDGELKPEPNMVHDLAQLAFQNKQYTDAINIVGAFAKQNPHHKDLISNYLLVGKSLIQNKEYQKAGRLLIGLSNKFPNDPKIIDVKSEILTLKRRMAAAKRHSTSSD